MMNCSSCLPFSSLYCFTFYEQKIRNTHTRPGFCNVHKMQAIYKQYARNVYQIQMFCLYALFRSDMMIYHLYFSLANSNCMRLHFKRISSFYFRINKSYTEISLFKMITATLTCYLNVFNYNASVQFTFQTCCGMRFNRETKSRI